MLSYPRAVAMIAWQARMGTVSPAADFVRSAVTAVAKILRVGRAAGMR